MQVIRDFLNAAHWRATDSSIAGKKDRLREVLSVYEGNMRVVTVLGLKNAGFFVCRAR
jgi:hypothetical protein